MDKGSRVKFYLLNICGLLCVLAPLLPWMSYGVGSKTGVDIGGSPTIIIFVTSISLLLFSYILLKSSKMRKLFLFLAFLSSLVLFSLFVFEIARIAYQTLVAKSLPVEMFGVVSLSAKQIKIGYGLWVGGVASFISLIINFISMRLKDKGI